MKQMSFAVLALIISMALAACGTTKGGGEGVDGSDEFGDGVSTQGIGPDGTLSGSSVQGLRGGEQPANRKYDNILNDPSSPLSKRVIYFMFNSSEVQPEYRAVISAHAEFLATHSDASVILEGHADERGSREYNIALGEQRANGVARMLKLQNVGNPQIQVISYGEEKPEIYGHGESSWARNRRVEFSYR